MWWTSLVSFPGGSDGKESACSGFSPSVGKIPCRKERLLTPVFWPGEFHGQRSLTGYSPYSLKESDTTEWLSFSLPTFKLGFPGSSVQFSSVTQSCPTLRDLMDCSTPGILKLMSIEWVMMRYPKGGNGNPLQYSCLEIAMVREA